MVSFLGYITLLNITRQLCLVTNKGEYMYNNNDRQPAVWTEVAVDNEQGIVISRSEKGAFKLQQGKRMVFFKASDIETIANASGLLMDFLCSDEYKQSIREHELRKEQTKVQKQMAAIVERQQKFVQAAIDQLTASGLDPEQAKQLIAGQLLKKTVA